MTLLPDVVKNFSVLRKKKAFVNLNLNNEEAWIKAQKLQEHFEVYGVDLYLTQNILQENPELLKS